MTGDRSEEAATATTGRIREALAEVRDRMADACRRAGRSADDVVVIGATKGVPAEAIAAADAAGLRDFGENYAQELVAKRAAAPDARWHFVGRLQRNKVRTILEAADVIHALEPGSSARRLVEVAAERFARPRCSVEVDFAGGRVGVPPSGLASFLEDLSRHAAVDVVGLMTVAPLNEDPRRSFAGLRALRDELAPVHPEVRELSMGMSADYEEAVEEGATMVRIGTAIFGPRPGRVRGRAGTP